LSKLEREQAIREALQSPTLETKGYGIGRAGDVVAFAIGGLHRTEVPLMIFVDPVLLSGEGIHWPALLVETSSWEIEAAPFVRVRSRNLDGGWSELSLHGRGAKLFKAALRLALDEGSPMDNRV